MLGNSVITIAVRTSVNNATTGVEISGKPNPLTPWAKPATNAMALTCQDSAEKVRSSMPGDSLLACSRCQIQDARMVAIPASLSQTYVSPAILLRMMGLRTKSASAAAVRSNTAAM